MNKIIIDRILGNKNLGLRLPRVNFKENRIQVMLLNIVLFFILYSYMQIYPQYFLLNSNSIEHPTSFILNSFLHSGFIHLFFNMFFVYQIGNIIDNMYNKFERVFLYLLVSIPITIFMFTYIYFVKPDVFLVGYSGVAFALLGASWIFMGNSGHISYSNFKKMSHKNNIFDYSKRYLSSKNQKWVAAQILIFHAIIILLDLNVSWEAHLVGFIFGFLYSHNRFLFQIKKKKVKLKGQF